ncbi:hypothetical protein IKE_05112 [Bacillus cereus VD196]|uniref:Uncharacterized protein n=1 Tax=Bacillus cereus VD196 TaxID=1053243 RepID=A0A9W5Q0T2_BACCE|nr:hypothetical protein [Bacillus cereus]EOO64235.1 hypothetical protein IKE_05112 [Bacillus cereus VD196]
MKNLRKNIYRDSVNIEGISTRSSNISDSNKKSEEEKKRWYDAILKELKYEPDQITKVHKLLDAVSDFAGGITSIIGTVNTVKSLLEFAGIIKKADPTGELLLGINANVNTLLKHFKNDAKLKNLEDRSRWTNAVRAAEAALDNLQISRSQEHFQQIDSAMKMLMDALNEMLDYGPNQKFNSDKVPNKGIIPFLRPYYKYYFNKNAPEHWIDYATGGTIKTRGGALVSYAFEEDELGEEIWDAGYYLDVLIKSIGLFISVLTVTEPAFRSTGHRRFDLMYLCEHLKVFIDHWERSFLVTDIDVSIEPYSDFYGHKINHPFLHWSRSFYGSIPLGIIDPITGVSMFIPDFREGLWVGDLRQNKISDADYNVAWSTAKQTLNEMTERVRKECGILKLYTLQRQLYELTTSPVGSQFTRISNVAINNLMLWQSPVEETLSLGFIGNLAGKPGRLYKAKRIFQTNNKTFRIPMVRRMDASGVQLGYRLEISILGGEKRINVDLCEFSAVSSPHLEEKLPLFPTHEFVEEIPTQSATVYDVVQSSAFSAEEESLVENGNVIPEKQRLLINSREGTAGLRVKVDFSIDLTDVDHQYIGYANVTVENPNVETKDAFIVNVNIFETKISSVTKSKVEEFADGMTLHVVPSYLIPEPEYFVDYQAGYMVLEKIMKEIPEEDIQLIPKPWEEVWNPYNIGIYDSIKLKAYEEFSQKRPEIARNLLSRFQIPIIHQVRPKI